MPPGSFFLPAVSRVNPEKYYSETEQSIYIPIAGQKGHSHQFQPQTRVVLVNNKPNEQIDSLTPIRDSSGPLDLVMTVYPHLPELLPQPHDSTAHTAVHEVRMVTPLHGYLPTNLKPASPRGNGLIPLQHQHLPSSSNTHSIRYHSFTEQDISPLNFIRPSSQNPNSGSNSGFNPVRQAHSSSIFIQPSPRDPFIGKFQNPNSGSNSGSNSAFNFGRQVHSSFKFTQPSAHDQHIGTVRNLNSGSNSGFDSLRHVHSSLKFIQPSAHNLHAGTVQNLNSGPGSIRVVLPPDFQSNLTTSKPQKEDKWKQQHPSSADLKVSARNQPQMLMIPANSREIVVRSKMATFPDSNANSDDSSFSEIEIITNDANNEHVLYVVGNRTNLKLSDQLFQTDSVAADVSPNSDQTQIQVPVPNLKASKQLNQSDSSSVNETSNSVRLKTQFQVPKAGEIHQKSVDGSPPQATAAESHGDFKATAGHILHFIPKDANKNATTIPVQPQKDELSQKSETSSEPEEEDIKDLEETESMIKPFYKFRKISPKGAVYTVKQGHSKVKFFGFNALHGPYKRVPEVTTEKKSLVDWTLNTPESRKFPTRKSINITLKRKTVRPIDFNRKPQNATT